MKRNCVLGGALVVLGFGIGTCALLGPLALDVLVYRTSPTSEKQIVGADAVGLLLVAPISVAAGRRVLAGRPGAALLGLAPAGFAVYTYAQLILGNEYLARPGNVERFFPLLMSVFVLALGTAVAAWSASTAEPLPEANRRTDRLAGTTLLAIAAFVTLGLHLPTLVDALGERPTSIGYLSSPTAFWLVKFMDLGLVVPAALVVGWGMLQGRQWARRPAYALVGGYTLLGASVVAMGVTMYATGDPDASSGMVLASGVLTLALAALARSLYGAVAHRSARPGTARHPGTPWHPGTLWNRGTPRHPGAQSAVVPPAPAPTASRSR